MNLSFVDICWQELTDNLPLSRQSVDDGLDDLYNRSSGEVLLRSMNLAVTGHAQTSDRNKQ